MYNAETVEVLAKHYSLVAIEKWYTPCGAQGPIQSGPECDVESKFATTFGQIKAINPNVTTIMYFNTMFNFNMFNFAGRMAELEAAGTRALLRDKHGELVLLCNDGNVFCNVTTFDLTQPVVLKLWLEHLVNATVSGHVDGVFADHATHDLLPLSAPQLCNGAFSKRRCYDFDPDFAARFNANHQWLVNKTQDILAPLGGPAINGPYASYRFDACHFDTIRRHVQAGRNGSGPYVLEPTWNGGCNPDDSCLAAFLLAATEYTYLGCFDDIVEFPKYPNLARPLGPPLSDAVLGPDNVWTRTFTFGATARWYPNLNRGTMQWSRADPVPPLPPSAVIAGDCGRPMTRTTFKGDMVAPPTTATTPQQCCDACRAVPGRTCTAWVWFSVTSNCTLHGENAVSQNTYPEAPAMSVALRRRG